MRNPVLVSYRTCVSDELLSRLTVLWEGGNLADSATRKAEALRLAGRVLRSFAKDVMRLPERGIQYEVRTNPGGPAVSGEVTLHTDPLPESNNGVYIQIMQGVGMHGGNTVLYRNCKGLKDFTGGRNRWCGVGDAFGANAMIQVFATTCFEMAKIGG